MTTTATRPKGFDDRISAPIVTLATARIDRRLMLCAVMLLLAPANFLAAAAPTRTE
ncbi:hypothetical protein K9S39_40145 [Streptomyces halobius]|uniref:Uncharacterized protein n=1 Tax=Streptomyces halobius TaxID=2879846 RepID=A0ABY4MKS1_9ACTN|nr:hypothetical protein [Streptomyces halobius]UQA98208.1 hypothetical protein K9S39_40145 [Streptomyces halobius]